VEVSEVVLVIDATAANARRKISDASGARRRGDWTNGPACSRASHVTVIRTGVLSYHTTTGSVNSQIVGEAQRGRTKVETPGLESGKMVVRLRKREGSVNVRNLSMVVESEVRGLGTKEEQ
jgi:hypothetical protein